MARAWLDHGLFPLDVLARTRGERAFIRAAYEVKDEETEKAEKQKK